MRRYSAGVQVPRAIIMLRRAIVSHDAAAISMIMMGSSSVLFLCRFMRRYTYGCFANDSESVRARFIPCMMIFASSIAC